MNSLAPAREYKYAMRQALKVCNVSENKFSKALFSYKLTVTKEQFLQDCFEAGIGQPRIDYPKRIAFVRKVMQFGSSSSEDDPNFDDSSTSEIESEATKRSDVKHAVTQADFNGRLDVAAFLHHVLSCLGHLSKQDLLEYLHKLAENRRVKDFVQSIDKAGILVWFVIGDGRRVSGWLNCVLAVC